MLMRTVKPFHILLLHQLQFNPRYDLLGYKPKRLIGKGENVTFQTHVVQYF